MAHDLKALFRVIVGSAEGEPKRDSRTHVIRRVCNQSSESTTCDGERDLRKAGATC